MPITSKVSYVNHTVNARRLVLVAVSVLLGCAAPQTQIGSISSAEVAIEQARQQQFVLENVIQQTSRVQRVATPIFVAAAPLCGDRLRSISGIWVANAHSFGSEFHMAARSLGLSDTLVVLSVVPGSPATQAGLAKGDRIVGVNGGALLGSSAPVEWAKRAPSSTSRLIPIHISYERNGVTKSAKVNPTWGCSFDLQLVRDDAVNAYANGQALFITTGMMRFAQSDEELAVVVGHELAHNAMRHNDAAKKNAAVGGLLGAVADIAAAALGVNTGGEFTKGGIEAGAMVFSQDFEREADYVGLYMLALSGRELERVPNFWRRMAVENPKSVKFAGSHPTTAERFVRLDQWRAEIDRKNATKLAIKPDLRKGSTALVADARLVGHTALAMSPPSDESQSKTTRPVSQPVAVEVATEAPVTSQKASYSAPQRSIAPKTIAPTGEHAQSIIGVPSSDIHRLTAIDAHNRGKKYLGAHEWAKAEESFRLALQLDGSVAEFHASLGSLMMMLKRSVEAEAEFSAALLIDVDNEKYRKLLKESRSKRH